MNQPGPVTIFAALEPDAALSGLIHEYKRQTRALVGEQLFLDDPPHLTVYLASFAKAADALSVWPRLATAADQLPVRIAGWHVFDADPLTGNHTLVCDLAAEDKQRLRAVQSEVIAHLSAARDRGATHARFAPRWTALNAAQRASVESLGFPYTGDGWEPHFTIASIRPADWPRVWQALCERPPHGEFHCRGLRLYQLVDESPVAIDARK